MFRDKNDQKKWLGASIAGVVGSLAIMLTLSLKKKSNKWIARLKNMKKEPNKHAVNHSKTFGSITGGLIGAAAALLLAPKSGKELLKDLYLPFIRSEKSAKLINGKKAASKEKSTPHSKSKKSASLSKATPKKKKEHAKNEIKKTRRSSGNKIISSEDILPKEA